MLTKRDRHLLLEDFKEVFATKTELEALRTELKGDIQGLRTEVKDEILTFKDEILGEIINLRTDFAVLTGYRDMIENHELRLDRLEKQMAKN